MSPSLPWGAGCQENVSLTSIRFSIAQGKVGKEGETSRNEKSMGESNLLK